MRGIKRIAVCLVFLIAVMSMPGCTAEEIGDSSTPGAASQVKLTRESFFTNEEYAFTLDIPDEVLPSLTWDDDADWSLDQDLKNELKHIYFFYSLPLGQEDVFEMCVIKSEITESEMDELNPMMTIIGTNNGYTYTVQYAEDPSDELFEDADALNMYYEFMNDNAISIAESIRYDS